MDISTITDIDKLKSLAYDTLNVIEQQQQNLRIIQERIAQIEKESEPKKK
ncbi:MAG: hypothetical protein WAW80_00535 [Candidatus Saccharimonadales bacterium]